MSGSSARFGVLVLGLALSACTLGTKYERPAAAIPESWPVGDAYLRQSEAALPAISYRDIFRDPRLQEIVERALINNRDLAAAAANIAVAREQFRIQRSDIFPQIDTTASVTESDRGNGAGSGIGQAASGRQTNYRLQGGITAFELDLFGRIRSLTESARNRYFATEAGARATRHWASCSWTSGWSPASATSGAARPCSWRATTRGRRCRRSPTISSMR